MAATPSIDVRKKKKKGGKLDICIADSDSRRDKRSIVKLWKSTNALNVRAVLNSTGLCNYVMVGF